MLVSGHDNRNRTNRPRGPTVVPARLPDPESVFVTHAPDAVDVAGPNGIATYRLAEWYWAPLSYQELAEWTDELTAELAAEEWHHEQAEHEAGWLR